MSQPEVHPIGEPGGRHGTFRRHPYGMTFNIAAVPDEKDSSIDIEFGIDTEDHQWFVLVKFHDPDLSDDLFKTSDERCALMWFGHTCYMMQANAERVATIETQVVEVPTQLVQILSQLQQQQPHNHNHNRNEPVNDNPVLTGQYL